VKGTTPAGAQSEQEAARWVRGMFGRVAHRYDLANHLLSFNVDRYWRAHTVKRLRAEIARPEARVLDLCCGTGDLVLALEKHAAGKVYGSDFCHPMLEGAKQKIAARRARAELFEADALNLPLGGGRFDVVTVAFGFRNLANYTAGFEEMRRLLKPGGVAAILEFTQPPNRILRAINDVYCRKLLPIIGGAISGASDAYHYLPESVRKFPAAPELADGMRAAGFEPVTYEYMTGGLVALHLGTAPDR
jgi:demethylmenaquinone methyltransferase/2-methoxy-6-polyprenyl-1,4-benzoquinol methylase